MNDGLLSEVSPIQAPVDGQIEAEDNQLRSDSFIFRYFFYAVLALFLVFFSVVRASDMVFSSRLASPPLSFTVMGETEAFMKHSAEEDWVPLTQKINLQPNLSFKTGDNTSLELALNSETFVRLARNTVIQVFSLKSPGRLPGQLSFQLISGKVWFNNSFSDFEFNVFTNQTVVIPLMAAASVEYADNKTVVYADHQALRIGLLSEAISDVLAKDFNESLFLNHFLLTEGNSTVIPEAKITPALLKLRYSKLIKEFPFSLVTDDEALKDNWISFNRSQDDLKLESLKTDRLADFISLKQPAISVVEKFKAMSGLAGELMTFLPEARLSTELTVIFDHLFKAQAFLAKDEPSLADEELNLLEADAGSFLNDSKDQSKLTVLSSHLAQYERSWQLLLPGDIDYSLKTAVARVRRAIFVAQGGDIIDWQLSHNKLLLSEISDLLRSDRSRLTVSTKQAFTVYLDNWVELKTTVRNSDKWKNQLFDERQILQNLLFRWPILFEKNYFSALSDLESLILEVTFDEVDANEYRLTFINDNLKTLARLIFLIKKQDISLEKGLELGNYLVKASEKLKPGPEFQLAVSDYFKDQLKEFNLLLEFFASPEYAALKGVFDEKIYEEFKAKKADLDELKAYLANVQTQTSRPGVSLDEAKNQVYKDFTAYDLRIQDMTSLGDSDYRLFEIKKANYGQILFSAKYDRDSQIVYEIKVDDRLITAGVHVSHLPLILSGGSGEPADSVVDDSSSATVKNNKTSKTDEVAINLVLSELNGSNLVVDKSQVKIIDLANDLFQINRVFDADKPKVVFSFQYDQKQKVTFLADVETVLGKRPITGRYPLKDIAGQAEEVYNQAENEGIRD